MSGASDHVALILVSHSRMLAEGVAALARQMTGDTVTIICAAGMGDNGDEIGTDAMRILEALTEADHPAGCLVLMDLGSALLSAEMALDLTEGDQRTRVILSAAPFVEGGIAAAVAAGQGLPRAEVERQAVQALRPKIEQLGGEVSSAPEAAPADTGAPDAMAEAVIPDPHGLHARPAAQVAALAAKFKSQIGIARAEGNKSAASAVSMIDLMTLGVRQGDRLIITASGADAQEAVSAMRDLIQSLAGKADPAAAPAQVVAKGNATPVSPGIAVGPLTVLKRPVLEVSNASIADPQAEIARLDAVIASVGETLGKTHGMAGDIAAVQIGLLAEPGLIPAARTKITDEKLNATAAVSAVFDKAALAYRSLEDAYLRAREADLLDLRDTIIAALLGRAAFELPAGPPAILLADELPPSVALVLDPAQVLGVIERRGGATSHAAILLRGAGIPAIANAGGLVPADAATVAFDGATGAVLFDPTPEQSAPFVKARDEEKLDASGSPLIDGSIEMRDGRRIELWANVVGVGDAKAAVKAGALGIGLLRTEMMFLDRQEAPGEIEQMRELKAIFDVFAGKPIVVRTLDAGGDKPVPYMNMPEEANPFLGVRGLRLSLAEPAIFQTQLRAILRAAAGHDVRIMLPMVTQVDELHAARRALDEAHAALDAAKIDHRWPIDLGIMVEVPAAALTAKQFAHAADFFSIGTNDLTQYTLAAERGNPRLGTFADAAHPAVLSLIRDVVEAAGATNIPVSVCGEAAGDPDAALLLVASGVTKLSMGAASLPRVAKRLLGTEANLRGLRDRWQDAASAADVRQILSDGETGDQRSTKRA